MELQHAIESILAARFQCIAPDQEAVGRLRRETRYRSAPPHSSPRRTLEEGLDWAWVDDPDLTLGDLFPDMF